MKAFLFLFLVYLLMNLGLIALGAGLGYFLHRMSPSVDLGSGILIGVVSAGFSIHYFVRMLWFFEHFEPSRYESQYFPNE